MVRFVQEEDFKATFPYLDNICGKDQPDHDVNLECSLDAAERKNITYNDDKSVFSTKRLPILGYEVEEAISFPEPAILGKEREALG